MPNNLLTEAVMRGEFRRLWAEYTGWPVVNVEPRFYLDYAAYNISARWGQFFVELQLQPNDLLMSVDDFSNRLLLPMMHSLATETKVVHPLRDLACKIEALAKEHPGYSQAQPVIQNAVDHLSAIARCHECNAKLVLNVK